ncbi:MAG: exodeoxyribonuclease VII small subunit [Verrucomicrobia bacterium]|nr:exodeoxyribonuclease VII small subunit [Verrucomicrobiota bacterium]
MLAARRNGWTLAGLSPYFPPVSKAAKVAAPANDQSFEEALKKLEAIVETMESGDLPLDQMLERFEDGTKLAQVCQTRLGEAELKISQVEKNTAGGFALKPVGGADED